MEVKNESNTVETKEEGNTGVSRRSFLKILGQTSAVVGAAGCGKSSAQKILPYVKAQDDQIKGVSVWYNTTCTECDAGCGIQVRTREGRAVKIDGNHNNPINRGGVCAIGHSALQNMYDPDRVRQPVVSKPGKVGEFQPVAWAEGIQKLVTRLKPKSGKVAYLGNSKSGAMASLISDFCSGLRIEKFKYNSVSTSAESKACELVYGVKGIPTYDLEKADVILNFGADYLETWVSPCELARGWADSRRKEHPARVIHVEPRLSLTGASADSWLMANPGTEVQLALALLKLLIERGKGSGVSVEVVAKIQNLTKDLTLDKVAAETGIAKDKILLAADSLYNAKASAVLAGGASATTATPLPLLVAANLLNIILGNVGTTINLASTKRESDGDLDDVKKLITMMKKGQIETLIVDGSNPVFNLPPSFEFEYGIKKVQMLVSLSSQIDETTHYAHLILPTNTGLESWGDVEPTTGVYGLIQPVMKPVFDTKSYGDLLIEIARAAGSQGVARAQTDFLGFLKERWQGIHVNSGSTKNFQDFWLESVEAGGYFANRSAAQQLDAERVTVRVQDAAFSMKFVNAKFGDDKSSAEDNLYLLPYPSVRSFDGRSANRPWLNEIPDPMSQISWDSWVEIHPDTAKKHGIVKDDLVTIRNHWGEINVGVVLTPYIHPNVVACPVGFGHTTYGRFAQGNGGNVMHLLSPTTTTGVGSVALFSTKVRIRRGRGTVELANMQGSDSQMDRELARVSYVGGAAAVSDHAHAEDHGHNNHHEPKQMYVQREHPVYKWGMAVDLAACTGCSACVVACYSENNIPTVGRKVVSQGREMSWLRIERYYDTKNHENGAEELHVSFLPMMCQQCGNAPCEPVCPTYATYHSEEGLNVMVYNRCVGTRYCSNNCSYKVRRFNWIEVNFPEPMNWQLNPDVTPRSVGVMEKCTFCIQRIVEAKDNAKDLGRLVEDGEIKPACVQSCPTQALTFGNLKDPKSKVSMLSHDPRAYKVLDHHLNTQPAVSYLEDIKYREV
ncbi:MAG: 4Fe-4S dicluster domain-containing protein [bacterium]|nr:4Fe-4S dicluster domain-containing protein [bacterium]